MRGTWDPFRYDHRDPCEAEIARQTTNALLQELVDRLALLNRLGVNPTWEDPDTPTTIIREFGRSAVVQHIVGDGITTRNYITVSWSHQQALLAVGYGPTFEPREVALPLLKVAMAEIRQHMVLDELAGI